MSKVKVIQCKVLSVYLLVHIPRKLLVQSMQSRVLSAKSVKTTLCWFSAISLVQNRIHIISAKSVHQIDYCNFLTCHETEFSANSFTRFFQCKLHDCKGLVQIPYSCLGHFPNPNTRRIISLKQISAISILRQLNLVQILRLTKIPTFSAKCVFGKKMSQCKFCWLDLSVQSA